MIMNNEIKEIIDCLELALDSESYKTLLDYITNLQQEIEEEKRIEEADLKTIQRLEEENERLKEWKEDLLKENIELENIRKEAIEYIENPRHEMSVLTYQNLLNILQNGSDDN